MSNVIGNKIPMAAFDRDLVNPMLGPKAHNPSRLSLLNLKEAAPQIHKCVARVKIEYLPYRAALDRYDPPHTFFYLDPPCYGIKIYRFNIEQADFERLAEALAGLKGKFLISFNDHKDEHRIFRGFRIERVSTK